MVVMASSGTGTPSRSGRNSLSWWSRHARSTSCDTMWRGAEEMPASGALLSAQTDLSARKCAFASSKLPVFSAVFTATIVARVVKGIFLCSISAMSLRTSSKLRVMKCMARSTSYVRWSGARPTEGISSTTLSTSSVSRRLPRESSRSLTMATSTAPWNFFRKPRSSRVMYEASFLKRCMDSTEWARETDGICSNLFIAFQHFRT
mmetsp:Transcript_80612/g.207494  ORF Transcript_80612/g.207494 Transcript_80612/m.207494 type:complete len:205 (+) Transcript_80612:2484-3098(+)